MAKLILFILFMPQVYAVDLVKHPIYAQILRNSPKIDKKYAMRLSNAIYKSCKKYSVPTNIYTAILRQESNYRLHAIGKATGLHNGQVVTVKLDFGVSQINYRNVIKHKFDIDLLLNDMLYSVMAGAKILSTFKRFAKKDPDWWTSYNCGTRRGGTKRDTCQLYKTFIQRYM